MYITIAVDNDGDSIHCWVSDVYPQIETLDPQFYTNIAVFQTEDRLEPLRVNDVPLHTPELGQKLRSHLQMKDV